MSESSTSEGSETSTSERRRARRRNNESSMRRSSHSSGQRRRKYQQAEPGQRRTKSATERRGITAQAAPPPCSTGAGRRDAQRQRQEYLEPDIACWHESTMRHRLAPLNAPSQSSQPSLTTNQSLLEHISQTINHRSRSNTAPDAASSTSNANGQHTFLAEALLNAAAGGGIGIGSTDASALASQLAVTLGSSAAFFNGAAEAAAAPVHQHTSPSWAQEHRLIHDMIARSASSSAQHPASNVHRETGLNASSGYDSWLVSANRLLTTALMQHHQPSFVSPAFFAEAWGRGLPQQHTVSHAGNDHAGVAAASNAAELLRLSGGIRPDPSRSSSSGGVTATGTSAAAVASGSTGTTGGYAPEEEYSRLVNLLLLTRGGRFTGSDMDSVPHYHQAAPPARAAGAPSSSVSSSRVPVPAQTVVSGVREGGPHMFPVQQDSGALMRALQALASANPEFLSPSGSLGHPRMHHFQESSMFATTTPAPPGSASMQSARTRDAEDTTMGGGGSWITGPESSRSSAGAAQTAASASSTARPLGADGAISAPAAAAAISAIDRTPRIMHIPSDDESLSPYQCLVRKQIEVFEASEGDTHTTAQGRNRPIVLGQVGIRCIHCGRLPIDRRARGAAYFPSTLISTYQTAQNMANSHLIKDCLEIPKSVREDLIRIRLRENSDSKNTRKSAFGGGRGYWASGLRGHAVIETNDRRLRFGSEEEVAASYPAGEDRSMLLMTSASRKSQKNEGGTGRDGYERSPRL